MIYLLEDDESIRELVCYSLNTTQLQAIGFSAPPDFWNAVRKKKPDLILLDIMLPGESGLSILKQLRQDHATARIPVIMLTARGTEYDKVIALDAGADDYVTKPFGVMELLARVKALLRRAGEMSTDLEDSHTVENLYVSISQHTVSVDGQEVLLTYKEFQLLCYLLAHRGTVLSRDQILRHIWEYEFDGENRTVDVHIRTLRQKLGTAGHLIETVRGVGYRIGAGK